MCNRRSSAARANSVEDCVTPQAADMTKTHEWTHQRHPITTPTAVLFVLLLTATAAFAQTAAALAQIDAVTASPNHFRVLLENDAVRVIEYALQPGERDDWHTHPAKVSYIVSGGTLRVTTDEGQSFLSEEKAGEAVWAGPVGRHYVQNVGPTPVTIVLTEVKGTPPAHRAASLIGTWKLVKYEDRRADGTLSYPFGEHPTGYFVYDATGHLSVQIMRTPALKPFSGMREGTGDGASYREAFLAYAAYFGTYAVDATKGTVTHQVEGSLRADYTGTDQVRRFRIEGDRLIIEIREGQRYGRRELIRVQ